MKDNVRALIHVLEGKLLYRILSPPSAHSLISYQAELEPMVKLRAAALAFFERNP